MSKANGEIDVDLGSLSAGYDPGVSSFHLIFKSDPDGCIHCSVAHATKTGLTEKSVTLRDIDALAREVAEAIIPKIKSDLNWR
jgi:hypothetical protein